MATFVLVHGAGDSAWYWHLVAPRLQRAGHQVATPECPTGASTLAEWTRRVVEAGRSAPRPLVVVAQSFGAFPATVAADRLGADLLVLVAGMVPRPGESPDDWWTATAYTESGAPTGLGIFETFLHDVDREIAEEALSRGRDATLTDLDQPVPLADWPAVPTRYVLGSEDRFFPASWLRRVVEDRLGIEPDVLPTGHCPALSRPEELAALLTSYLPSGDGQTLDTTPLAP
ncbi:MAG TPA: alpha/beta hydrolase [Marmoricola sp.]|nr:alpha/beta hydrolase [Marmoricola sp.]